MSIYATLPGLQIEADDSTWPAAWAEVAVQAVPPHIGHPDEYPAGDPYAAFLPPPAADAGGPLYRAVVFLEARPPDPPGGPVDGRADPEEKDGQRYVRPLLVLTGAEFRTIPYVDLYGRLQDALLARRGPTTTTPGGPLP